MFFRKEGTATPEITAPEGCAGRFALLIEKKLEDERTRNVIGERVVASMTCQGLVEEGNIELAGQILPHDSISGPWPSRKSRQEGLTQVAARAAQEAVLICTQCPASVLAELREAKRTALLVQAAADRTLALEEVARQQDIAAAIKELTDASLPDARQILGGDTAQPSLPPQISAEGFHLEQ